MRGVHLRLVLTTLIWALVFQFGVYAVALMHPLAVAAWRFGLAAVVLLPLVQVREHWPLARLRANAGVLIGMAITGVFLFNIVMFRALSATSAVNAALIMALSPPLTTVLTAALARQRVRSLQWLGLVLGLAGVACVVSNGSWTLLWHLRLSAGDGLMLLACASWSIYATLPDYARNLSPLQTTGASTIIGAGMLVAVALATAPRPVQVNSWLLAATLLFMGVVGTAVALVWWNEGVQRLGAARATLYMNLTPVFAALIAIGLGRPPTWAHLGGAALVIAGVYCSARQADAGRPA
jgi:drug/metabolite transporter (DMT)-like permease